jgi:hypothetical protein
LQPSEALELLERIHPSDDAGLAEVSRVIAGGMTNGFPTEGDIDADFAPTPLENLPLWLEFERARRDPSLQTRAAELSRLEREDWRSALRIGLGYCSQASLIAAGFLRERGIEAEAYGLGGHVVTRAFTGRGERVLDCDYGIMLPFGVAHAAAFPDDVRHHYLQAGYPSEQVAMVVACYGDEGNSAYYGSTIERAGGQARMDFARRGWTCALAALVLAMLPTGAIVRRRATRARSAAAMSPSHAS